MLDKYDVVVIGGFGHIGLPLAIMLADAGLSVSLYDIDESKRATIEEGKLPFVEYGAEPVLQRVLGKRLFIAPGIEVVGAATHVIICIGTPLDEYMNPKLLPMFALAEKLTRHLRAGQHVLIRSTVYPGTSERLYKYFLDQGAGIHLSVCPERIVQGYAITELRSLPQIISGFSDEAVALAKDLFKCLDVPIVSTTVKEAELAKLFTNAWRYIKFAIANQFYTIAVENGADFSRIHRAIAHGYERASDFPGPGFAAGPCLLKDCMQLAAFHKNNFQLGYAAMQVNEGLPSFIVERLLSDSSFDIRQDRVGILGMSFKADIDDIRDSLSYKLAKILRFHGVSVVCSDEYVSDPSFVSKEELLSTSRVVIVGVPHKAYRGLAVPADIKCVDPWGALANVCNPDGAVISKTSGTPVMSVADTKKSLP